MKITPKICNTCPQSGPSLLSLWEAVTPRIFERRVQKRCTSKKMPSHCPQNGRSMIEMLGVLAIIGVLSVGGIMGYSKAMMRYKINKTIEQITYIAGNIRTTFANQGNYDGLTSNCPNNNCIIKKAHIVPDDMWNEEESAFLNMWDGYVEFFYNPRKDTNIDTNKAFSIQYDNIPEEACIELITHDWSNSQAKMIRVWNDQHPFFADGAYIIPPARLDDAIKVCASSSNDDNGIDYTEFHFDIDISGDFWKNDIEATTNMLSGS